MFVGIGIRAQLLSGTSPAALFTAGEVGIWYDPSDLSTMFQDSAGTIPVTAVGQPVGLRLDKSKGLVLGPELVTNGDFSNGTTGWTFGTVSSGSGSQSAVGGRIRLINDTTTGYVRTSQLVGGLTAGKFYQITGNFYVISGTPSSVRLTVSGVADFSADVVSGRFTCVFAATGTSASILPSALQTGSATPVTLEWDNISVRELPGFHASQSTPGSRAIYASVPKGGRRNIYTNTGFSGGATGTPGTAPTGWVIGFATGSITAITADASLGGNSVTVSATAARQYLRQQFSPAAGTTWTLSADMVLSQQTQMDTIAAFAGTLTGATQAFYLNGALVTNITQVPAGSHRIVVTITTTTTALTGVEARIGIGCSGTATGTVKVSNPQLEAGSVATAYQIVRTIYDIQEAGVQTLYGLLYDGLDDFYVTSAINFSATDKMTVFAGVRKLSDAAQGVLVELTNSATNRFTIFAPPSGLKGYLGASGGSTVVFTPGTIEPAPHSAVLTLRGDISGDLAELRVNSTTIKQVTTDQGTGNYANAALYIGRRGGTTLPFNGYEFGLIVRGAATNATQIASTEAWLNTRTGAY